MSNNGNNGNNDRAKVIAISLDLQQIATEVETKLSNAAGERLAFVLVVSVGKVAQYVSNASRPDGMALLEQVQDAWKNKRADIPAHYHPERPQ